MMKLSEHWASSPAGRRGPLEDQPAKQPTLSGLLWHVGAFATIGSLCWIIDLNAGRDGAQWAHWVTLVWGTVLVVHVVGYWARGQGLQERGRTQNYRDVSKRWGGF